MCYILLRRISKMNVNYEKVLKEYGVPEKYWNKTLKGEGFEDIYSFVKGLKNTNKLPRPVVVCGNNRQAVQVFFLVARAYVLKRYSILFSTSDMLYYRIFENRYNWYEFIQLLDHSEVIFLNLYNEDSRNFKVDNEIINRINLQVNSFVIHFTGTREDFINLCDTTLLSRCDADFEIFEIGCNS